ncbi:MAG: hypothetical protein M3P08_07710 [Thermoproteota archaeon]|nr:hypothetical protein [Thermoproteota archaeon]
MYRTKKDIITILDRTQMMDESLEHLSSYIRSRVIPKLTQTERETLIGKLNTLHDDVAQLYELLKIE